MKTGVVMINFGEPAEPTLEQVVPFLERIFFQNRRLEEGDEAARRRRSRELAEERASGLVAEYEEIGGSPLNAQADAQASAVEEELRARGRDVTVYSCYQYTAPYVAETVARAREDGVQRLVVLPVYPLCGHSTNVLALEEARAAVDEAGWDVEVLEVGGWHRHPDFLPMWGDHVEAFARGEGVDPRAADTALVFSIHGTPLKYLEAGNRYDRYVDEACLAVADHLRVGRYHMGYQNHTNRPISWTEPDVEALIETLEDRHPGVERVLVVPIAFMHEQSETLAELDEELREEAEAVGLAFHRAPVPWDDARFPRLLADLVESRLGLPIRAPEDAAGAGEEPDGGLRLKWRRCLCRAGGQARCLNGLRLDPTVELARGGRLTGADDA